MTLLTTYAPLLITSLIGIVWFHYGSNYKTSAGLNVHSCTVPKTVALTFDDGPQQYMVRFNRYVAKLP